MALNKYVEAAKDSYKQNRTGNKYVDAVVSGSSITGQRKTVRSEAAASYTQKQQRKKQASDRMTKLNRQTTRQRMDTGESESRIGTGWENRADLDKLWGQELSTKAYQDSVDNAVAKLDNSTPDTTDMNNATRYEQMQEARRRANNKTGIDAGKQEAFETAKWEEAQRIGIQGAKNPQLLQNLQQLNNLYTTANMGHESVAGAAKEQYDTLYNRLKQQYGDRVDDWTEYVKRLQNAQSMGEMTQRIADAADKSPVVASLATPIVNVASGAGILDVGAQRLGQLVSGSNTPIDYNRAAQLPSNWVTTTRGTVSDKIAKNTDGWIGSDTPIGNLWSGAYNLGMSMADSVVGQKLGGATYFMGGAAATNAMNEARQRGASTDQALGMGLLAGAAETVMEKIPMDRLLSQTNPTSVRSAIKNILRQSASEATEEGLTTLANTISDAIIIGDKSELNTAVRAYRANGYSDSEAQKKAFTDWLIGLAGDTIGGAVSGGLFAAGYNVPGGIAYKRSGGDANSQNNASSNVDHANANTDNANPNAEANAEQNSNTDMDPLEFAVRETMKPSREQQAMDQALQETADWMLGKEQRNAETTETTASTEIANRQATEQNQNTNFDNDMGHGAVGAAEAGFNPYSNYQNRTDAADFMPEGANAARPVDMPKVDPMGRQVRSGAKTIYGAEATTDTRAAQMENEYMDGLYGYDPVRDKPTLEKAKTNLQEEGYDRAYARVAEKLAAVKDMKQTAMEAFLLYSDAVQSGRDADAANLCLLLSESGTEFGQGAQVFSMFRKLSPEGQLYALQKSVERLNNKIKLEHRGKALEIEIDPELARQYINAPNQQVRDTVTEQFYQNIGKQIPTSFAEAASQWRYMSMLLNPSTHLKNMGGNLSMMMLKGSKDVVGTGIEFVANAASGGKVGRTKSVLNPLRAKDRSLMETAWADFDNVRDDVAGIGKNTDNLMGKAGEYRNYWKLNDPKTKAGQVVDKALRTAEKVPQANTKLMNLEDQLFSQPDYALSLAGYMKANHQTEVTAEARAYAIKEAQKATFRDANSVSTFARNMGHSNGKFWSGIVNAIFPFKGTPANVGVRAVEYSPLGFANTVAQAINAKKNGTFKATDFIDNISANLVGSALSVFGYWLASNGWLRVSGAGDEKERAEQRGKGYQNNSFRLFGYSVPENSFTSASAPMFIGAAAYEAIATKAMTGEAYTLDDYIEALSTTVDPLLEQTMLTGLDDVLTTARYNQGGLGDTLAEMSLQVAGSYLSSFIPTLLSRISAAIDGTQRQVYIDKNKPLQGVQRQVQNLMMKTPARQYLNERVDRYGNVQEQGGIFDTGHEKLDNVLNFGYNVVTPSYARKIQENPISDELSRLYRSPDVDNTERKLFQSDAPKSIQVNGVTKNLTGQQYENYEKIRGNNTTEYLGALQNNSVYGGMDDAMQGYATDKMHDYIEQTSKAALGIGYKPTEGWIADLQGKSDAEIVETVLYKTFEAAVDSKQYSSKYDGMDDLMDQGKLSDAMAITMMPEKMQTVYQDVAKKGGVSVNEWLDMYAYAYPAGKTDKGTQDKDKVREAALEYIGKQGWSESKKVAAANAVFQFLPNTAVIDVSVPGSWALDYGDSGLALVESYMGKTQTENYEKYIKGHLDNDKMKLYLDAYAFKGTAKSDKNEKGDVIYSAKNKVIDYIDSLDLTNREKIRVFLGLDYAESSIPYWWMY